MVEFSVVSRGLKENKTIIRSQGLVPGIVYGGKENICITAKTVDLKKVLQQAGRSNLVQLDIEGKKLLSLVKDFQLHPLSDEFIHFDLLEVSQDKEVKVQVPLKYVGTAKGSKEGGILEILLDRVDVISKVKHIPSSIEVDITHLEMGFSVHLKDIKVPANTRFAQDLSTVLVVVAGESKDAKATEGSISETSTPSK